MDARGCVILAVVLAVAAVALAAPPVTVPANDPQLWVRVIERAPDASSAVAVFADAVSVNKNNPAIYRAYVRRMVDLAVPQLAADQAQTLVKLDAGSGLGWAVLAHNATLKNDYRTALSNLSVAVACLPNDPFVVRTAGQILAWYDSHYKFAELPTAYQQVLAQVNERLMYKADYAEAYAMAAKTGSGAPTSQPVTLSARVGRGAVTSADRRPDIYGSRYRVPPREASVPIVLPPPIGNNPVVSSLQTLPPQNTPPPVAAYAPRSSPFYGGFYQPGLIGPFPVFGVGSGGGGGGGGERD
jgi:hypothetical protein